MPAPRQGIGPEIFRDGPLGPWLDAAELLDLGVTSNAVAEGEPALFAGYLLQNVPDYRGALRGWFDRLRIGGHLIVVVPYTSQSRFYTPGILLQQVEEALTPNSYRVRWLGEVEAGQRDVALVIERITPPAWGLSAPLPARDLAPDFAFEPVRTRAEALTHPKIERILALALGPLGSLILSVPALEKLRASFAAAHLTLVVGSSNEALAGSLRLADELLVFDRNTTEAPSEVESAFVALIDGAYDLAIDLSAESETRPLLRTIEARLKAGLGNWGQFPFLDIFLPIDPATRPPDPTWSIDVPLAEFHGRPEFDRTRFHIAADAAGGDDALVWGPDRQMPPGDYLYQPAIEIDRRKPSQLAWDIACDDQRTAYGQFDAAGDPWIAFTLPAPGGRFAARLFAVPDAPVSPFRFYGGRLVRSGPAATLGRSESLALLIELVKLRIGPVGMLDERAQ